MAEPVALQAIVGYFAHALDAQRFPAEVPAVVPPAGGARKPLPARGRLVLPILPVRPRMALERALSQSRASTPARARRVGVKVGRKPTWCSVPAAVVQAEQEGPHQLAGRIPVPAEARHGTVGGALVLDLDHGAAAGLVRAVEPLRDHAVQPGALEAVEPVPSRRRGRVVAGVSDTTLGAATQPVRSEAARTARRSSNGAAAQVVARRARAGPRRRTRPASRSPSMATRDDGRVDPLEQRVEVEAVRTRDHHFAVHAPPDPAARRRSGARSSGK